MKELFALYLTFASPVGDVELFVKELPNCENASIIAEQEYAKRGMDRSKLSQSGYMCIGWEFHILRQKFLEEIK
jgi:hypothetical protein